MRIATAASEPVIAYVGLGTNVGQRRDNLRRAVDLLRSAVEVRALSSIYETDPVGFADQPRFWNMAARVATTLSPHELMRQLIDIEMQMGRERTFRNAPRIIDLDLLLYRDAVIDEAGVTVPHPRMHQRAFVLVPLLELDPDLKHPVSGVRFADILEQGSFEQIQLAGSFLHEGH